MDFAVETAQMAGAFLMENLGKESEKHWTSESKETNFKIAMDRKSDELIRSRIQKYFSEDDIYSEEAEDIKSRNNIVYESKTEIIKKYSVYSFTLLCVIICVLIIWRKLE